MRMRIPILTDGTNEVDIKLLEDGRALVHWLRECDDGLIVITGHPELRKVMGRPTDGKYTIACNTKQNTTNSQTRRNTRFLCMTSGDLAAVTCSKCLETAEAKMALSVPVDTAKVAQLIASSLGV